MENGSILVHIVTAEKKSKQIIRVLNSQLNHLNLNHSEQGHSACFLLEAVSVKLNTENNVRLPQC